MQGSLLGAENDEAVMKHAPSDGYDFVLCTGVLHHLKEPSVGLRSLSNVLAPSGGGFVMLYGEHGRTGVYPLQDMLRAMAPLGTKDNVRIPFARRLVQALPRNHPVFTGLTGGYDLDVEEDDAPFYDLLLHSMDTPFTVEKIIQLEKDAGNVHVVDFVHSAKYEPSCLLGREEGGRKINGLDSALAKLSRFERYAVGEKINGRIGKHYFYFTKKNQVTMQQGEEQEEKEEEEEETLIKHIHAGMRLTSLLSSANNSPAGEHSAAAAFFQSDEGRDAIVCPTGDTTTWKVLVDRLKDILLSFIMEQKSAEGWTYPWSLVGQENDEYHFDAPPLIAEIAVASSDCQRTVEEMHLFVRQQLLSLSNGEIDVKFEEFARQVIQYVLWGESLLSVTISLPNTARRLPAKKTRDDDYSQKKDRSVTTLLASPIETTSASPDLSIIGTPLSDAPPIIRFSTLLSKKQTNFLKACAEKKGLESSPHGGGIYTGKKQQGPHRTSLATFLTARQEASPIGKTIMALLFAAAGSHPSTHAEVLQIQKYNVGGKYSCHFDPFWNPEKEVMSTSDSIVGGQRTKTLITYLHDTPRGGETVFPYAASLLRDGKSNRKRGNNPFLEISVTDVCKQETAIQKKSHPSLLRQTPLEGTSILFHHFLPNGDLDVRSWHCSCPVQESSDQSSNQSSDVITADVKWIAQLWLRDQSRVLYRDANLIAMWPMDDAVKSRVVEKNGFTSICPSSRPCPHHGNLSFPAQDGMVATKIYKSRPFRSLLPPTTRIVSSPDVFSTVSDTKALTLCVTLQLPVTHKESKEVDDRPLLAVEDKARNVRWSIDLNDVIKTHIHPRRVFTIILSIYSEDQVGGQSWNAIGNMSSFGENGADLGVHNIPVRQRAKSSAPSNFYQQFEGGGVHEWSSRSTFFSIGFDQLNVPLSTYEVLAFDRRLSDSEMSTLLTAPTMELMGWEAENFS